MAPPPRPGTPPVLQLKQDVINLLGQDNPFAGVEVVLMEFTEPNVADGVHALEQAQCDRIVAVPLFIAPSSHSHWDIPALLGLYSDIKVEKALQEEGTRVLRCNLPITLTPTLTSSDVIDRVMLQRVRELSTNPKDEAVVVLAHGSEYADAHWQRMLKRTVTGICGQTGISYGDWACVAVGQNFEQGVAAIAQAAEHRQRVLVVGAYLSSGTARMAQRWQMKFNAPHAMPMHGMENPLANLDVHFSQQGLLPDPAVAQWIVTTALDEIKRHP